MIISEHQYHAMCRDAVVTLVNAWGLDKFNEWYRDTILPMNGKVYLDYHSYYIILKGELDGLYELYDQTFGGSDYSELLQEQEELRGQL